MNARDSSQRTSPSSVLPSGERLVVWVLWLTYGSFYFCRTNIAVAVPGMEAEFGFTKTQIGSILGALKLAYGIGQLVNGQLAERFSPRLLLAIGMLASATLNVVFGLSTGLYFLLFVWAMNGYCQALGWTPCMRVAANWFPVSRRGRRIGVIGTGYQLTAALTYVVSGAAADAFGWRFAFYIPAVVLVASCVHMFVYLEERPRDGAALAPPTDDGEPVSDGAVAAARRSFAANVALTLSNPVLWFLALALGLLNACRYGFLDWGITHLYEVQGETVGKAAIKYAVLPLGGIVGAYASGWASDRFFASRRTPVIFILLCLLGVLTLLYSHCVQAGTSWTLVVLTFVGFAIYGPQVLLVGTAPVDAARGGTSAAAVGFVNFMGYMGAYAGDRVTGSLADASADWQVPLYFWASCAFAAALLVAFLWYAEARKERKER
jgi:sugar phosphate permease